MITIALNRKAMVYIYNVIETHPEVHWKVIKHLIFPVFLQSLLNSYCNRNKAHYAYH